MEVASRWCDDVDGGIFLFERTKAETGAETFDLATPAETWILVAKLGVLHMGRRIKKARFLFYRAAQR